MVLIKKLDNKPKSWLVTLLAFLPFFHLLFSFFTNNLSADPIRTITIRTGWYALVLLFLTLVISPLTLITQRKFQVNLRKIFGLMTFFYAFIHFLNFAWYDFGLNTGLILNELTTKPFIILGALALLDLFVLFIFSFDPLRKKLGKTWFSLQKTLYFNSVIILVHFYLAKKGDKTLPLVFAVIFLVFLVFKIPAIKHLFSKEEQPG